MANEILYSVYGDMHPFFLYCIFFFIGGGAFEFKVQMEIIFIRFNVTGLQEIRSNMLPNGHNASGVMS